MLVFPERAKARDMPAGDAVSVLAQDKSPVADGRGIRQQVREQMLRTEREWVVNVPEKEIELEKTLGGD